MSSEATTLIAQLFAERSRLDGAALSAIVVAPASPAWEALGIGLTPEGLVAVVMASPKNEVVFPIRLQTIEVTVLRGAHVIRAGDASEEDLVLVICRSTDALLMEWFVRVATSLLGPAIGSGDASRLVLVIMQLAQLFEHASRVPTRTVVGLWGELAVITASSERSALVDAWRSVDSERFDFAYGTERLEVKTNTSSSSAHFFSVQQLRRTAGETWIVVVKVQRQGAGVSVHDLAAEIRHDLAGDVRLLAKVDRVMIETLGSSYSAAAQEHFDLEAAMGDLGLYSAESIPCVPVPLPAGVLSARLEVDLAGVARQSLDTVPESAKLARLPFS